MEATPKSGIGRLSRVQLSTKNTLLYVVLGLASICSYYLAGFLGAMTFQAPHEIAQRADLIERSGVKATFIQLDDILHSNEVVVIYARYALPSDNLTKPFNFTVDYKATLRKDGEDFRTYVIHDKSIEMRRNGTKFVKLMKLKNVRFDGLTLNVECRNLGSLFPVMEVRVFIASNQFAVRKKFCHNIFVIYDTILLIRFLYHWRKSLSYARVVILLISLSVLVHQRFLGALFLENSAFIDACTSRVQRAAIRYSFISIERHSLVQAIFSLFDIFVTVRMDFIHLLNGRDEPGTVEMYIFMCFIQMVYVIIRHTGDVGYGKSLSDISLACFIIMFLNDFWVTASYRINEPANWFVLPMVIPDLFAGLYAGLVLDVQDPLAVDTPTLL